MSDYLWILSVQSPFTIGKDDNGRTMFSVNFEGNGVSPITDLEREIVKLISDAGLGAFGNDTFIGPNATLPTGGGPYVQLISTGGSSPLETHDGKKQERFSFQILVRAISYTAGRTRIMSIWRLLDGFRNQSVTL